jgi:hypothetical protein
VRTGLQSFWDKISLKLSVEQVNEFLPEFEQAKEIEKQQIIDAITIGFHEGSSYMDNGTTKFETALEYYNETFKSK